MDSDDLTETNPDARQGGAGSRAGKYRIAGQIGQGGMGLVFRAVDEELGRQVALKFLPESLAGQREASERFLREARAASALDHVNIGSIFGVEETGDGRRFLVMAYYEGENLAQRMRRGVSYEEAIEMAIQIARGLREAHAHGIVHRDIKPSNIMLNAQGVVKIVDFGLARMAEATRLTSTGMGVGTPAYMSPEQAQGMEVDGRTDLWSLGVVLLEMLTGERAFRGSSTPAVLYQVVHGEITLLERLEEPVRGVVSRALERDLTRRYATAGEMVADLEALAAGGSVSGPARAAKPGRRWVVAACAAVAVVMAGGAWKYTAGRAPAKAGADGYQRAVELMQRWDKDGNLEESIRLLTAAVERDGRFALGYARLAEAQRLQYAVKRDKGMLEAAAKNVGVAVELNGELAPVQVTLGRLLAMQGKNDLAQAAFLKAIQLDGNEAEAHQAMARQLERQGRAEEAESSFRRALSLNSESLAAHDAFGNFLFRQGRHLEALAEWQSVLRMAPDHAGARLNAASALNQLGRTAEAIPMLQASIAGKPTSLAYMNLGTALTREGRYGEGAEAYRKALELQGDDSMVWGNLGYVYSWMKDPRAGETFARAIALAEAKRKRVPRDPFVHSDLALYYAKTGKAALAQERLQTALALAPKAGEIAGSGAEVYEILRARGKAVELARRALQLGHPRWRLERNPELQELMREMK